jgi:hypothetical protein
MKMKPQREEYEFYVYLVSSGITDVRPNAEKELIEKKMS